MQIEVQLTDRGRDAVRRIRRRPAKLAAAVEAGMRRAVKVAAGVVVRESLSGQNVKRRTGALARSIDGRIDGSGLATTGYVGVTSGPAAKYAKMLETGGTITMKGKRLAIPVGPALTPTGRQRFPGGPRSVPDLVLITPNGKPPMLAKVQPDGTIEVYFVLKTSVKIPATEWLSRGMQAAARPVTETLQRSIDAALNAA